MISSSVCVRWSRSFISFFLHYTHLKNTHASTKPFGIQLNNKSRNAELELVF